MRPRINAAQIYVYQTIRQLSNMGIYKSKNCNFRNNIVRTLNDRSIPAECDRHHKTLVGSLLEKNLMSDDDNPYHLPRELSFRPK